MPFFEDIGAEDEALRRPIWGAFALVKDNLERLITANIGWSLQLLPAIVAYGFVALPLIVRLLLVLYSLIALIPATGVLFRLMARVCQSETLRLDMLKEDLREMARPSFISLSPLLGMLALLFWLAVFSSTLHILLLDVLIRFTLLLLLVCALYWGPLFAEDPGRSAFFLLRQSALLAWRYPVPTLLTGCIVLFALIVGAVSIGGLFLIMPVVVALLQTRRYQEVSMRLKQHNRGLA
ncbi:MAG: hypothetical protein H0V70_22600 [Ktedonobacteraceae bacterium]|nr:hypothetical protein [Ktedonobacteraceae bacterium]